jgi:glucose-fructose oxidoreductase
LPRRNLSVSHRDTTHHGQRKWQMSARSLQSGAPMTTVRFPEGSNGEGPSSGKVRYAVVGLGRIAQAAILPAFEHCDNAELVALVSGDDQKLADLGQRYGVTHRYRYERYEELLTSGLIDAVYLALPNHLHADYAIRAAKQRIHVLCEKPLAVTSGQCRAIAVAARDHGVKLMTAYRLHFERANLEAIEIAHSRLLGELRCFNAFFTMDVKRGDIRLSPVAAGGGTLFDVGIYCINAARCIFRAEPEEVFATSIFGTDKRFDRADEMTTVMMRFPRDRIATFTVSFGAAEQSTYTVIGTRAVLRVDPAFLYSEGLAYELTVNGRSTRKEFKKRDQFAAELVYFSGCVLSGRDPEPNGIEGWADVRVIEAAYTSAAERRPVRLVPFVSGPWPDLGQEIHRPSEPPPPPAREHGEVATAPAVQAMNGGPRS